MLKKKIIKKLANSFVPLFIGFLYKTCRIKEKFLTSLPHSPVIYAGWHGILPSIFLLGRKRKIATIVSKSEDGELIAPVFKRFGFTIFRGSSHRGGISALKQLTKILKRGYDVGLAVDGSQGPLHKVQGGVLFLAMHSGYPIVPLNVVYKYSITLPSWDKMEIPIPFSSGIVVYGKPLYVSKSANKAEINKLALALERYLFYLGRLGNEWLR